MLTKPYKLFWYTFFYNFIYTIKEMSICNLAEINLDTNISHCLQRILCYEFRNFYLENINI